MGYGDPLPQSHREAELHAIYVERAKKRMNAATDTTKAESAERRYSAMHERESARRMRIASQMAVARQINPEGGFWYVDDSARAHCPTCEARGGRNYTWDQLDEIDPTQNHAGCRCAILPALQHGEWAPKYNRLTETLINALVKRGNKWVVVTRDDTSHFPQRFARKDGSSSPGPPRRPRGGAMSGPINLKPGQKFSGESYLSGLSQAKKKMLLSLGSYEVIGDLVGCTDAVAKRVLGGNLEKRYRPRAGKNIAEHEAEILKVAEKIGLIPDRALLRTEKDSIREKERTGEISKAEYFVRRKQIEDILEKRPKIHERGDRKSVAPPEKVAPSFGTASTDYAVAHVEKPKPRGTKYPEGDAIKERMIELARKGHSSAEILALLGGPSGLGVRGRTEAANAVRDAIEIAKRRSKAEKLASDRGEKRLERLKKAVEQAEPSAGKKKDPESKAVHKTIAAIMSGELDDNPQTQAEMQAHAAMQRAIGLPPEASYQILLDEYLKPAQNRRNQWQRTNPVKAKQAKAFLDQAAAEMKTLKDAAKDESPNQLELGNAIVRAALLIAAYDDYALQNDGRRKSTT